MLGRKRREKKYALPPHVTNFLTSRLTSGFDTLEPMMERVLTPTIAIMTPISLVSYRLLTHFPLFLSSSLPLAPIIRMGGSIGLGGTVGIGWVCEGRWMCAGQRTKKNIVTNLLIGHTMPHDKNSEEQSHCHAADDGGLEGFIKSEDPMNDECCCDVHREFIACSF